MKVHKFTFTGFYMIESLFNVIPKCTFCKLQCLQPKYIIMEESIECAILHAMFLESNMTSNLLINCILLRILEHSKCTDKCVSQQNLFTCSNERSPDTFPILVMSSRITFFKSCAHHNIQAGTCYT